MINKITLIVAVLLAILTITLPRKYFAVPFILAACFVPTDQRIILMGLDFTVLRILVAVGILRILIFGEQKRIGWNRFDKVLFAWVICGAVIYSVQWMNVRAIVNRAGVLFDVIGLYWLFRQRIRNWDDVKFIIRVLAISITILAPLVMAEWVTGQNPFAVLGRVATDVRTEQYRCQAAFPHSIMLGLFAAVSVPLFTAMAVTENNKIFYLAGLIAAVFIVVACTSSTPILVLGGVVLVMLCFKLRRYTAKIGWAFLASVVGLHIVMRAPVWHLLARVNVIGASTGWHRYNLINQAIKHFDEWAFLGCRRTEHWGFGLGDVTNQYILEGVRGGLVTAVIFLVVLYMALKTPLSLCLRQTGFKKQFPIWCLFAAMTGHCAAFFGVSYFGQINMLWYMMLAMVGLLAEYELFLRKSLTY